MTFGGRRVDQIRQTPELRPNHLHHYHFIVDCSSQAAVEYFPTNIFSFLFGIYYYQKNGSKPIKLSIGIDEPSQILLAIFKNFFFFINNQSKLFRLKEWYIHFDQPATISQKCLFWFSIEHSTVWFSKIFT